MKSRRPFRSNEWKEQRVKREREGEVGSCRTLYCQFDEKIRRKCSKHVNNIMSVMGDNLFIQIFDKPHQPDDGWWLSRPSILCSMMMMIHSSMINFINLVCNIPFIFIFIFTTVKSWISFYCSSHLQKLTLFFYLINFKINSNLSIPLRFIAKHLTATVTWSRYTSI